jgi:hypothetical protein
LVFISLVVDSRLQTLNSEVCPTMESLLRWGIENSTSSTDASNPPPAPRQDLDPAIIDMILGKSDAELMKEDMAVAKDESQSESARIDALDHLEMVRTVPSLKSRLSHPTSC